MGFTPAQTRAKGQALMDSNREFSGLEEELLAAWNRKQSADN